MVPETHQQPATGLIQEVMADHHWNKLRQLRLKASERYQRERWKRETTEERILQERDLHKKIELQFNQGKLHIAALEQQLQQERTRNQELLEELQAVRNAQPANEPLHEPEDPEEESIDVAMPSPAEQRSAATSSEEDEQRQQLLEKYRHEKNRRESAEASLNQESRRKQEMEQKLEQLKRERRTLQKQLQEAQHRVHAQRPKRQYHFSTVPEACRVFGITSKTTSISEIKSAYRKLAAQWHPDRFAGHPERAMMASDILTEINCAYKYLKEALKFN